MIRSLPASSFAVPSTSYVDHAGLLDKLSALAWQSNVLLSGPAGSGKSLAITEWCARNAVPLIRYDCSEDVRRSNLLGSFVLEGGQTPFVLGPLPQAIEVANSEGKAVLCLEEINALAPSVQKLLNPLLDWRKALAIPEAQQIFTLGEAQLWVVGTLNERFAGTFDLNADLKSRVRMISVPYPEREALIEVCKSSSLHWKDLTPTIFTSIITLVLETASSSFSYHFSPREAVALVDDTWAFKSVKEALQNQLLKFDEPSQKLLRTRLSSILP